jgi:hypothetical protein
LVKEAVNFFVYKYYDKDYLCFLVKAFSLQTHYSHSKNRFSVLISYWRTKGLI